MCMVNEDKLSERQIKRQFESITLLPNVGGSSSWRMLKLQDDRIFKLLRATYLSKTSGFHLHPDGIRYDLWPQVVTPDAEGHDARAGQHLAGKGEVEGGGVQA